MKLTQVQAVSVIAGKMSTYRGSLSLYVFLEQITRLSKLFKGLDDNWVEILKERCKAHSFTDERLIDAVNNVIDKFKWGEKPTPANILEYDRTIEMLTSWELMKLADKEGKNIFAIYDAVDVNGEMFYTLSTNIEKYGLKVWEVDKIPEKKGIYPEISDEDKKKTAALLKELVDSLGTKTVKKNNPKPKYVSENYKDSPAYLRAKTAFEKELKNQNRSIK